MTRGEELIKLRYHFKVLGQKTSKRITDPVEVLGHSREFYRGEVNAYEHAVRAVDALLRKPKP